jgi:hypothetical protein
MLKKRVEEGTSKTTTQQMTFRGKQNNPTIRPLISFFCWVWVILKFCFIGLTAVPLKAIVHPYGHTPYILQYTRRTGNPYKVFNRKVWSPTSQW